MNGQTATVKNIKIEGSQVFWTIETEGYGDFSNTLQEQNYRTNKSGEGIFAIGPREDKQQVGTSQFSLRGMSKSGMYKKIRRYFFPE